MIDEKIHEIELSQIQILEDRKSIAELKTEWELKFSLLLKDAEALTIEHINDKVGLKKIHDARMYVKNTRLARQRKFEELTEVYQERIKVERNNINNVKAVKDFFDSLSDPVEKLLKQKEDWVDEEMARIEEQKILDIVEERKQKLISIGMVKVTENLLRVDSLYVEAQNLRIMNEDQFNSTCVAASEGVEREAEKIRLQKEREAKEEVERQKAIEESKRLAAQKAEQEKKDAEIRAEQEKIAREKAQVLHDLLSMRMTQLPQEFKVIANQMNGLYMSFSAKFLALVQDTSFEFTITEKDSFSNDWPHILGEAQKIALEARRAFETYNAHIESERLIKAKEEADRVEKEAFHKKVEDEKRASELQSDREKLITLMQVVDNIKLPDFNDEKAIRLGSEIRELLARLSKFIRKGVEGL